MSLISEHEYYSKSSPSRKPYVTMVYDNGTMTCDCRGWTIKKKGKPRECTHTKKTAKKLGLVPVPLSEEMYYAGELIPEGVVKAEPRDIPDLPVMRPNDGTLKHMEDDMTIVELKYDGTYAFLIKKGDNISMTGRSFKSEYTKNHPEMIADAMKIPVDVVLCGEFVFFDEQGQDHFLTALATENTWREYEVKTDVFIKLIPKYMVFDIVEWDGIDLRDWTLFNRKLVLAELFDQGEFEHFELVEEYETIEEKQHAWEISTEGIIIKKLSTTIKDGRTNDWRKVKKLKAEDYWCIGLTEGTGRREDTFGAMMFGSLSGEVESGIPIYNYVGNVGTGFNDDQLEYYMNNLVINDDLKVTNLPKKYMYLVEPLKIEVKYQRKTKTGSLIMPRFVKDRRDITG